MVVADDPGDSRPSSGHETPQERHPPGVEGLGHFVAALEVNRVIRPTGGDPLHGGLADEDVRGLFGSANGSLPTSDTRCLRSRLANAHRVSDLHRIFSFVYFGRNFKIDAVVIASGEPSGRAIPGTPLGWTQLPRGAAGANGRAPHGREPLDAQARRPCPRATTPPPPLGRPPTSPPQSRGCVPRQPFRWVHPASLPSSPASTPRGRGAIRPRHPGPRQCRQ